MTRSRFGSVCIVLVLLVVWSASAQAAAKRVGIPKFDGKQEALVRKNVMKALKAHGFELVKSREMEEAISSTGAHPDTDDGLKTLAKELALAAIITGEVGPKRAKIVVHDGAEGSVLGDASFAGANPRKLAVEVGRDFWRKLGADVGRGQVPRGAKKGQKAAASEAPEDNEEAPEAGEGGDEGAPAKSKSKTKAEPAAEASSEEAAPAAEKTSRKKKPKMETPPEEASDVGLAGALPWIDVEVDAGGLNRGLSFHEDISASRLFPYTLGIGPIVGGKVVFYPLALATAGWASDLGVETTIEQGFVSSSLQSGSGSYSNVVHDFAAGVRYRIPFSGNANTFYGSLTGGEQAFTFNGANRSALNIPDTIYRYGRLGVGLRLALPAGLSVTIAGGYRYVANQAGTQISTHFFPHLSVAGADADLVGGYALTENFEIRAGVSWRRYWYNMHSRAGDTFITGGAVDQYIAFTAGIAFMFGGGSAKPEPTGEDAPPPPPPPSAKKKRRHSGDSDESEGDSDSGDSSSDKSGDKSGGDKSGGDADQ